ncbi:hypothetical protein [Chryseobacterium koreense]
MKLSDKSTAHILVKANTNSEWDNCEFAIIHISEEWKQEQAKRLALVKPLEGNLYFCSMNYYDTAVDFYRTGENDNPNIEELLNGKEWVFVELDEQEQEAFTVPENRLDCYRLVLRSNGTGYYTAYGKHTSEEFWTEEFLLTQLIA